MALQTITNINIDFCDKKYILINAKQYDRKSRFLSVTCYNHGELYPINAGEHSAYIRYKKSDNHSVFNFCEINNKGKILVELTEQMLASEGICCADLVIVNKGKAGLDYITGEITTIDNSAILSTMPLHIDVSNTAVENSDIESSYEFNGLNTALEKAEAEYTEVIQLSKSYAVGNAGGIRKNEDTDNSKYYYEQSFRNAGNSEASALNAAMSEKKAEIYMNSALLYSQNAETYMNSAQISETNSYNSEVNAKTSEINTKTSETNSKNSEVNAGASEAVAKTSAETALESKQSAKVSEVNALNCANVAQSYAVGGTGTRDNEDFDNAHYYYELMKNMVVGLDSGFIPQGTVLFSELASVEKATGYVYNISDDFITDDTFREGAGRQYTAGTNVYYTASGYWDCFGGYTPKTATVSEITSYLGLDKNQNDNGDDDGTENEDYEDIGGDSTTT